MAFSIPRCVRQAKGDTPVVSVNFVEKLVRDASPRGSTDDYRDLASARQPFSCRERGVPSARTVRPRRLKCEVHGSVRCNARYGRAGREGRYGSSADFARSSKRITVTALQD